MMNECTVSLDILTGQQSGASKRSREFQSLIRGIGDSKSKHEEDKVAKQELIHLKQHLLSANITSKQTRECLICLIYCEMLGHDASFGYIHAIKLAEQSTFLEKRTGYLAASIFLQHDHELVVLLISTLQKDLKSTNVVFKCAALNIICKLIGSETAPALLPLMLAALKDKRSEVRKKALLALQRIHTMSSSLLPRVRERLANALCDPDPGVVSASLPLFYDLIKKNPADYRGYLKAFLQVLWQIMEGKLSEFNFHGVQAPWIQIKLLKILALLGRQHKSASESMSGVLLQMLNILPTDCNIGCAVMFECIRTITVVYPNKQLLDIAVTRTGLFLTSNSSDLKCLGIIAMTALVEVDLSYAADPKQQQVIINCLDADDLTMRKKTLELLYKITNSENVTVVSAKLLNFLTSTTEQYIKAEVATNLAELARKYAPDAKWLIATINDVIETADTLIPADTAHRLMRLIAEAEDDDKAFAVSRYIDLLNKITLPDTLVQISCWVIGEYGYLVQSTCSLPDVLSKLTALLDRKFSDPSTPGWVITAVAKLSARIGTYLPEARGIIDRYRTGFPAELRQRCHEINILASDMTLWKHVFPVDSEEEDFKVCPTLSFLDDYVSTALSAGARHYQPQIKHCAETPPQERAKPTIHITPYEDPLKVKAPKTKGSSAKHENHLFPARTIAIHPTTDAAETVVAPTKQPSPLGKISKATSRPLWGPSGYSGNKIAKQDARPIAVVPDTAVPSSRSSSSSCQESCKKEEDAEVKQEASATSYRIELNSKQLLSNAIFSGVVQAKRSSATETSYESSTSASTTDNVDEAGTEDMCLMNTQEHDTGRQDDELDIITKDGFAKETDSADARSVSGVSEEQRGTEVPSLTDTHETGESEFELEMHSDHITQRSSHESSLLVDIDSEPVSYIENEQREGVSAIKQNGDFVNEENCLTIDLDASLESNESSLLNEPVSLLASASRTPESNSRRQISSSTELCSDSNVRLVYCAVHKPTELVLSMELTNHCQTRNSVEKVSITTEPPSNLVAKASSNSVTCETLVFLNTLTQEIPLTCQYPAAHMTFKGTVRYTISKTAKVLYFHQDIASKELLRPLNISTEEFGEKWLSTANDVRQVATLTSPGPCEKVMNEIALHMNFAVVDIIGCEGIAAATVLGQDICLLHCNFQKDAEFWIKSSSKLLSEITMKQCALFWNK